MVDQTAAVARAMGAEHWRFVPTVVGTPGPGASFRASTLPTSRPPNKAAAANRCTGWA